MSFVLSLPAAAMRSIGTGAGLTGRGTDGGGDDDDGLWHDAGFWIDSDLW